MGILASGVKRESGWRRRGVGVGEPGMGVGAVAEHGCEGRGAGVFVGEGLAVGSRLGKERCRDKGEARMWVEGRGVGVAAGGGGTKGRGSGVGVEGRGPGASAKRGGGRVWASSVGVARADGGGKESREEESMS